MLQIFFFDGLLLYYKEEDRDINIGKTTGRKMGEAYTYVYRYCHKRIISKALKRCSTMQFRFVHRTADISALIHSLDRAEIYVYQLFGTQMLMYVSG